MKTFLLALTACTLAACSSYAQTYPADTTTAASLKPQARRIATELNVNPFNGTISLNNSINQLKFRYFTAPNFALRLGFTGSRESNSTENSNPYGTNSYRYEEERSTSTLGVNVGVEKHFTGTKRLSPYIGGEIALVNKSTEHEITDGQTVTTIKGAWRERAYVPGSSYMSYAYTEPGYFRYGLNLISGFDFYMAKHFFFGYEVNFGLSKTNHHELDVRQTGGNSSNNENSERKNSTLSVGPSLMNGVRIGYVF